MGSHGVSTKCCQISHAVTTSLGNLHSASNNGLHFHHAYANTYMAKFDLVQNPYWYKALNSEPCISKGYSLMGDGHLSGVLNESAIQVFKSSPFWMQSLQCHSSMKHYF